MMPLLGGVAVVGAAVAAVLAAVTTVSAAILEAENNNACGSGLFDGSGPALAATAAARAGFTGNDLVTAVAVAGAESDYRPDARNSIGASGLWQILESAHPALFQSYDWRDPADNAAMAHAVWTDAGNTWTPWTTWTSAAYTSHLDEARAAVASLDGDSAMANGGLTDVPGCPPAAGTPGDPAGPFSGADGYVDDPTSSGRITQRMLHVYEEVNRIFGGWPWGIGCWDQHAWNPTSDHPLGRACDFTVGRLGTFPTDADRSTGWQLAHWLEANAQALGISYIIWDGRIWSTARDDEGWRPYNGGGVYNRRDPTGGHYDHLHVSVGP